MSVGMPVVLGVDPGLAHMGLALVGIRPRGESVLGLAVMETKKSHDKKTRVSDDNVRRAQELGDELLAIGRRYDIRMIAAEAMSFPEDASAAGKMSMSWGVLALFARIHSVPIEQASPQRIKLAVCGDRKASKEDVQFALVQRYGNHIEELMRGPWGKREHPFDALGAVVAKLDSPIVRQLRAMARVA